MSAQRAASRGIRYVHTNLVARDWKALAAFYIKALGCRKKPPERRLRGAWLDAATSISGARLRGMHLYLPGYGDDGPTLEIFQYAKMPRAGAAKVNKPGLGHIAFAVKDVPQALARVEQCGGGRAGEPVRAEIAGVGYIEFVYARDPEGNIIELQKWG